MCESLSSIDVFALHSPSFQTLTLLFSFIPTAMQEFVGE